MRSHSKRWWLLLFCALLAFFFWNSTLKAVKRLQTLPATTTFLSPQNGWETKESQQILKKEKKEEDGSQLVFWDEKANVSLTDVVSSRMATVTMLTLVGDVNLIYPEVSSAIDESAEKICFISKNVAVKLLGASASVGDKVSYAGEEYTIGGFFREDKDKFLIYGTSINTETMHFLTALSTDMNAFQNRIGLTGLETQKAVDYLWIGRFLSRFPLFVFIGYLLWVVSIWRRGTQKGSVKRTMLGFLWMIVFFCLLYSLIFVFPPELISDEWSNFPDIVSRFRVWINGMYALLSKGNTWANTLRRSLAPCFLSIPASICVFISLKTCHSLFSGE